jgi:hypothetical protein
MDYIRDPEAVKATLEIKDKAVITKTGCHVLFPERFVERSLALLTTTNYVYGLFIIALDDGKYTLCNICALVQLLPEKIERIKFLNSKYYRFSFKPNSIVIANTTLVKNADYIYNIMDEIVFKGNIPWYVTYNDLGKLLDTALKHAGTDVNKSLAVVELIMSILARDPKDYTVLYRFIADKTKDDPGYVSLRSVYYARAGTLNKIAGAYFKEGVVSALTYEDESISKIDKILRA